MTCVSEGNTQTNTTDTHKETDKATAIGEFADLPKNVCLLISCVVGDVRFNGWRSGYPLNLYNIFEQVFVCAQV